MTNLTSQDTLDVQAAVAERRPKKKKLQLYESLSEEERIAALGEFDL